MCRHCSRPLGESRVWGRAALCHHREVAPPQDWMHRRSPGPVSKWVGAGGRGKWICWKLIPSRPRLSLLSFHLLTFPSDLADSGSAWVLVPLARLHPPVFVKNGIGGLERRGIEIVEWQLGHRRLPILSLSSAPGPPSLSGTSPAKERRRHPPASFSLAPSIPAPLVPKNAASLGPCVGFRCPPQPQGSPYRWGELRADAGSFLCPSLLRGWTVIHQNEEIC